MKSKKIKLLIILFILFLVIVAFSSVLYSQSLTDIESSQSVLELISKQDGYMPEDTKASEYQIIENKNYCAVFYENNNKNNTIILQKSSLFPSKYKYFAADSTTSSYGKFKYALNADGKFLYVASISIREYDDFDGISAFCISKTNLNTNKNTIDFRETVGTIPYFDLFVDEFETDDKYDLQYHIYDKNSIALS